jgi:hypothetical protein
VTVVAMAGVLFTALGGSAQTADVKLGKAFEGETKTKKGFVYHQKNFLVANQEGGYKLYFAEVPVTLKAGQSISISTTVKGTGRKVALTLIDPDKEPVDGVTLAVRTTRLKIDEVSATGKYTILVVSDRIGAFTLRADGPTARESDEKQLKEKIKELEEELANLKKKLKTLQDKKRE